MILPRLILADEAAAGRVPPSLILIQAMRSTLGQVNVFFCNRSEEDVRLMQLLSDAPVTCLDLYTMGSPRALKTLFQRRSAKNALNVVSMPLGTTLDEKTFQLYPDVADLIKVLDCGEVPIMAASMVSAVSAALAIDAMDTLNEAAPGRTAGILFSSVSHPREFQVLEKNLYRKTPALTLGFMPRALDCSMPSMQAMSGGTPSLKLISPKSAALQLAGPHRQIEWDILKGLANLDAEWPPSEPYFFQAKHLDVAVMGGHASLEGDGNLEVFRTMGCNVYDWDHGKDEFPISADVLYFPHTINEPYIEELLSDARFRAGVTAGYKSNKLILAMGASSLLFGEFYCTASQKKIEALHIFPYGGLSSRGGHGRPQKRRRVEAHGIQNTCFIRTNEKVRGAVASGFTIANPGNLAAPALSFRDMKSDVDMGLSGWTNRSCFVTDLKLDLWSAPEAVNRWLGLRRRAD